MDELPSFFADRIPNNSALDLLASTKYEIIMEAVSYAEMISPDRRETLTP